MTMKLALIPCLFLAVVGSTGCGRTESIQEGDEHLGTARQQVYYAKCEVDAWGYQTGRCVDLHTCGDYLPGRCTPGRRYQDPRIGDNCSVKVNENKCMDNYE